MSVSRETKLDAFADLIRKWNPRINLVAQSTLGDVHERHIADSIQISDAGEAFHGTWLDLGSGGGFPGLVVAILRPDLAVTLVESDRRKAAFLRTVIRELGLDTKVEAVRIESLASQNADVISARALAPLNLLLPLAVPHAHANTVFLFPKGANYAEEVAEAAVDWSFTADRIPSRTRPGSVILKLRNVRRA